MSATKSGTILVNIARGALINDRALLAALDQGRVATAILESFILGIGSLAEKARGFGHLASRHAPTSAIQYGVIKRLLEAACWLVCMELAMQQCAVPFRSFTMQRPWPYSACSGPSWLTAPGYRRKR